MKKNTIFILFIVFHVFCIQNLFCSKHYNKNDTVFRYGFFHKDSSGNIEKISINNEKELLFSDKDFFKFMVQPITNVYLYLYHVSSTGELDHLFPANFDLYANKKHGNHEPAFIPPGNPDIDEDKDLKWFKLDDNGGVEEFYVIVSHKRLRELEEESSRYFDDKSKSDLKKRTLLTLLQKIFEKEKNNRSRIEKTEYNPFSINNKEPVVISGVVRDFYLETIIVEADRVYVKKITIKHKE